MTIVTIFHQIEFPEAIETVIQDFNFFLASTKYKLAAVFLYSLTIVLFLEEQSLFQLLYFN